MSRKDYIEVGGIMTRKNGKKYECVFDGGCDDCAFDKKDALFCAKIMCSPYDRIDGKHVHFIRRKDLEQN